MNIDIKLWTLSDSDGSICLGFVVAMVTLSVPLAQIPLIKDCH